jgi:hypothetical protein
MMSFLYSLMMFLLHSLLKLLIALFYDVLLPSLMMFLMNSLMKFLIALFYDVPPCT